MKTMAKTKKEKTLLEPRLAEEERETYLNYTLEKFIIIAKDSASITITIDRMMSGEPKNPPRP